MASSDYFGGYELATPPHSGQPITLDRGPGGSTNLAYDPKSGRLVEIHQLDIEGAEAIARRPSLDEAVIALRNTFHRSLARVLYGGLEQKRLFYVCDFADGEPIEDYFNRVGPLGKAVAMELVIDLIDALRLLESSPSLLDGACLKHLTVVQPHGLQTCLRISRFSLKVETTDKSVERLHMQKAGEVLAVFNLLADGESTDFEAGLKSEEGLGMSFFVAGLLSGAIEDCEPGESLLTALRREMIRRLADHQRFGGHGSDRSVPRPISVLEQFLPSEDSIPDRIKEDYTLKNTSLADSAACLPATNNKSQQECFLHVPLPRSIADLSEFAEANLCTKANPACDNLLATLSTTNTKLGIYTVESRPHGFSLSQLVRARKGLSADETHLVFNQLEKALKAIDELEEEVFVSLKPSDLFIAFDPAKVSQPEQLLKEMLPAFWPDFEIKIRAMLTLPALCERLDEEFPHPEGDFLEEEDRSIDRQFASLAAIVMRRSHGEQCQQSAHAQAELSRGSTTPSRATVVDWLLKESFKAALPSEDHKAEASSYGFDGPSLSDEEIREMGNRIHSLLSGERDNLIEKSARTTPTEMGEHQQPRTKMDANKDKKMKPEEKPPEVPADPFVADPESPVPAKPESSLLAPMPSAEGGQESPFAGHTTSASKAPSPFDTVPKPENNTQEAEDPPVPRVQEIVAKEPVSPPPPPAPKKTADLPPDPVASAMRALKAPEPSPPAPATTSPTNPSVPSSAPVETPAEAQALAKPQPGKETTSKEPEGPRPSSTEPKDTPKANPEPEPEPEPEKVESASEKQIAKKEPSKQPAVASDNAVAAISAKPETSIAKTDKPEVEVETGVALEAKAEPVPTVKDDSGKRPIEAQVEISLPSREAGPDQAQTKGETKVPQQADSDPFRAAGSSQRKKSAMKPASENEKPEVSVSAAQPQPVQTPAAQTPADQTPAAQTPAAQTPAAQTPAAQTPAAQTPADQPHPAQQQTAAPPKEAPSTDAPASPSPFAKMAPPAAPAGSLPGTVDKAPPLPQSFAPPPTAPASNAQPLAAAPPPTAPGQAPPKTDQAPGPQAASSAPAAFPKVTTGNASPSSTSSKTQEARRPGSPEKGIPSSIQKKKESVQKWLSSFQLDKYLKKNKSEKKDQKEAQTPPGQTAASSPTPAPAPAPAPPAPPVENRSNQLASSAQAIAGPEATPAAKVKVKTDQAQPRQTAPAPPQPQAQPNQVAAAPAGRQIQPAGVQTAAVGAESAKKAKQSQDGKQKSDLPPAAKWVGLSALVAAAGVVAWLTLGGSDETEDTATSGGQSDPVILKPKNAKGTASNGTRKPKAVTTTGGEEPPTTKVSIPAPVVKNDRPPVGTTKKPPHPSTTPIVETPVKIPVESMPPSRVPDSGSHPEEAVLGWVDKLIARKNFEGAMDNLAELQKEFPRSSKLRERIDNALLGVLSANKPLPAKAVAMVEARAASGEADMMKMIANHYMADDPDTAHQWLGKLATANEDTDAMEQLSKYYMKSDPSQAFNWLARAADKTGDVAHMKLLSEYFMASDPSKGYQWLERVAEESEDLEAMRKLSEHYEQSDPATAYQWLEKVADKGNDIKAMKKLSNHFMSREPARAYHWLGKVAKAGKDVAVMKQLGLRYGDSKGDFHDPKAAVTWLQSAADLNDSEAWYLLGEQYLDGDASITDPRKAAECYKKALLLGYRHR